MAGSKHQQSWHQAPQDELNQACWTEESFSSACYLISISKGITFGEHGLDVPAPVLRVDEVLGFASLAKRLLLQLRKEHEVGVHHGPIRLDDELLWDLVCLQARIELFSTPIRYWAHPTNLLTRISDTPPGRPVRLPDQINIYKCFGLESSQRCNASRAPGATMGAGPTATSLVSVTRTAADHQLPAELHASGNLKSIISKGACLEPGLTSCVPRNHAAADTEANTQVLIDILGDVRRGHAEAAMQKEQKLFKLLKE